MSKTQKVNKKQQNPYSFYTTKSGFWQMNLVHQKSGFSHNELYGKTVAK